MKKLTILMPSYNDCDTIRESLDSVREQTYKNWELIIIDDGSTDKTKEIIDKYKKKYDKDNRIKYLYQENQDQLIAIINGLKYAEGEYIYILHSDDLLFDKDTVFKAIKYLDDNPNVDSINGNLTIIDEKSRITGTQKVLPYNINKKIPAIQLLWLGRNLYVDMAFHRKKTFEKEVYHNYLTWNKPFWLTTDEDSISMLNVKTLDFSFFKYRIYSENYANNELGKLCLINGELRTATQLLHFYNIPFYKLQYFIFRCFVHLNLFKIYKPLYQNRECKDKAKIVEFIINKRYPNGYQNNDFFVSLVSFYKSECKRSIDFEKLYHNEVIYKGNGFRMFNRQLLQHELPKLYVNVLKEMNIGFNEIRVTETNKNKAEDLIKFLCIFPYVKITIKGEK